MKKLLVLMLVLGLSGVASAEPCKLHLIAPPEGFPGSPTNPLGVGETMRVYVGTDSSGLGQLGVTISLTGNGAITGGILLSEAASYGAQVTDSGVVLLWAGGWQSSLSFDTMTTATTADIGMGMLGSTIYGPTTLPPVVPVNPGDLGGGNAVANTPIAYIDIECWGPGDLTLTMVDGDWYGCGGSCTKMDDGTPVWDFGSPITIYQTGFNTCWDAGECAGQASGDATCDGQVNLDDLAALKAAWNAHTPWTPPYCCADFSRDDYVNLDDLAALRAGWGTSGYTPSTGNQDCP